MNSSKIRFYSATRNEEEIRKLAEYILPLNIRVKEKTGLLSQLFSFYLEEGNEQMAKRIYDSLEECLKKQKNKEPYIEEMSLLMDVYIYGDGKREAELLKLIETVKGEPKAICEIRLGVPYTKMKRNEDVKRMFE
ncbi:MAG: hypothetical protein PUF50_06725 [Erysipelotrichaceae bacterium]|nr:hypothetical protein [Erysipelotrichaceae bacterium]